MAIPAVHSLVAETITTAVTSQRITPITGLEGMTRAVFEAEFSGTGGTTAIALIRSRIGTSGTWREIATFNFDAAGSLCATVVAEGADPIPFGTLSPNTVLNWLGTELEAVITTTGTWASSVISVRVHVS